MITLFIVTALFWFAAWLDSARFWLALILLGYMLDWLRVLPIAWHEASDLDRWLLLACQPLFIVVIYLADTLWAAWMGRDLQRIAPRRESRECTAQDFLDTAR